jgi:hypothetical protein
MLWNNILIRLNKVCIIGSTFTAYCGGLINIQSCIDTTAETRINVLVFAYGPLLEYASAAHGIDAIARSKVLKDAVKKAKEAS